MEHIDPAARQEFRDNTRRYLRDRFPLTTVRDADREAPSFDVRIWKEMAAEMALQGIAIEEQFGGSGFDYSLAAILFEESGRMLAAAPFVATVGLAAEVIRATEDAAAMHRFLPAIAAGELVSTLAVQEPGASLHATGFQCETRRAGQDQLINGTKCLVLDAHLSDMIVVAARGADGVSLLAVDTDQDGVTIDLQRGIDGTRRVCTVNFNDARGALIGTPEASQHALRRGLAIAQTYLSCEMVGASQYLLDETVTYASTRIQFGRTIGSFQVVQHSCADMYVDLQFARSAVWAALDAANAGSDSLATYASIAKLACSEVFVRIAERSLQIHGGLGFTWEHFLHLYLKRAKGNQFLLGTPSEIRKEIAGHLDMKD